MSVKLGLTLKLEHRLRVCETKIQKRILDLTDMQIFRYLTIKISFRRLKLQDN